MRLAPSRPPARFSRRLAVSVVALLALVAPAAVALKPVPLDWKHTVGDPSIVRTATDYVVIATGAKVNRALSKNGKVWKWHSSALGSLPGWARPAGGDIWAADMEKVGSQYVLYFSAPIRGRTGSSRCIGAATSASATGTFVPVAGPPLVCPSWFTTAPAQDRIIDKSVIDAYPSASAAAQQQRKLASAQCVSASTSASAAAASANSQAEAVARASASARAGAESQAAAAANAAAATATAPATATGTATATATSSATPPATATATATATAITSPGLTSVPSPVLPTWSSMPPAIPSCVLPPRAPKPATAAPVIGAIDPSFFLDTDGKPYLLYKTDGRPSSIRILALTADGLHPAPGAYSQELLNNAGVLENPVMIHQGSSYYLFNSYGDYARCSYATVWRSSSSLLSWRGAAQHPLLSRYRTHKLCGPGGADVLTQPGGPVMYFEAWTCKRSWRPCGRSFWSYSSTWQRQHPVRALYAVRLGFTSAGAPYVSRFLKGSKH